MPTKPNSSRSRRSMKRRYPASSSPEVNSTNVGGDGGRLGGEEHLRLLAAAHRVRVLGDQPAEERVQLAGADPRLPARQRLLQRRHQPVDVPAGPRGDVDPRRPLHLDEVALDLAVEVVAPLLVDEVPLVERDHQRPARLAHRLDDPQVLLGDRLRAVDDEHRHLGALDRGLGAQRGVVLVARRGLHPLADAGGVDEAPGLPAELDQLVDRVDRRTRRVVDDHPVLACELVQQRGLADVGSADDRDPSRPADLARSDSGGDSGSAASTASSRSPEPRPCSAETGIGSPSPRFHSP